VQPDTLDGSAVDSSRLARDMPAAEQPALFRQQDEQQARHSAAQDPAASGTSVPLNWRPMRAPTIAPPKVDMNPCNEAPMPATEATGSMAMAPKLEIDSAKARHGRGLDGDENPQLLDTEQCDHGVQPRDREVCQQRRMRYAAHAEALDDSRIEKCRDPHGRRAQRKHRGHEDSAR
jgi:hypothetical protein